MPTLVNLQFFFPRVMQCRFRHQVREGKKLGSEQEVISAAALRLGTTAAASDSATRSGCGTTSPAVVLCCFGRGSATRLRVEVLIDSALG